MLQIDEIVKGKVFGEFVVIGLRKIDGQDYAQLKEYIRESNKLNKGELALPVADLIQTGQWYSNTDRFCDSED